MASESRALAIQSRDAAGGFNEAEANWPRNPVVHHRVRHVFGAASMRPRPIGLGIRRGAERHARKSMASMRPRPIGLGIQTTRTSTRCISSRFNEAEANWPRNHDGGRGRGNVGGASMRPRPIGLGISSGSQSQSPARCASMRPRPIGLGIPQANPNLLRPEDGFNEAEANWPRNRGGRK